MTGPAAVRWGILSTARINRKVIPGAQASHEVELLGVASRDAAHAEAYAQAWGIERAYGSYEALLEDRDLEAVYISLPNAMHCEWSIRALEAGKHVLCEKPLSAQAAAVEAAFDAADRAGRLLMEAFMYRHHPQTHRLAELVASGAIGELRLVRSCFGYPLYDPVNIRLRPELEGGGLLDIGCYCVSGSRLLAGEPELVLGERVLGPTGVDVMFAGTLRFPGDVLAQFLCATCVPDRDELEAIGSEGSLFLDDPWHCASPGIELRRPDGVEWIPVEPADSYQLELENLSRAIRGLAEPLLARADAVAQARTIEALVRSAESGESVAP